MNARFYAFSRFLISVLLRPILPYRVRGRENVPEEGACVICSNHTSAYDPLVIGASSGRTVRFMSKEELFKNPVVRIPIEALGGFPVSRGGNDLAAVRTALQVLRDGYPLGIFPAGTRAKNGVEQPWQSGTALIAMRADVPVVPVYISRPFRPFRMTVVTYGAPFRFEKEERRFDAASLEKATEKMRAASLSLGK